MKTNRPVIGFAMGQSPAIVKNKHVMNTPYIKAVAAAGGIPLIIPVGTDISMAEDYVSLIDGLLLPGGEDVLPELYHEAAHHTVTVTAPEKDALETELVKCAVREGKPVFGICRGMQLLNVIFGGNLYQDLPSQQPSNINHRQSMDERAALTHSVSVLPDTLIGRLLGAGELSVNTYHHQAAKKIAPGFSVSAVAPDGVVEAIECPEKRIYAVQWHPEELVEFYPRFRPLFEYLVEEASR